MNSATIPTISGQVTLYGNNGEIAGDATSAGQIGITGELYGAMLSITSPDALLGQPAYFHDGTIGGPGTYDLDFIDGPSGPFNVMTGQAGGLFYFDWGVSTDVPVWIVWDVSGDSYLATDSDGDGIRGHQMTYGPFSGLSMTIDFTVSTVPVPAAIWLFGSGLLGIIGLSRHKKSI